ncbi:MAG: protein kinase, partial [Bacteriovoracaceae bacterium]|nr:protein kinase [Bacteriovoracaceae bacterium]
MAAQEKWKPTLFGRYLLVDRLAAHDQTEIFLARPLDNRKYEICTVKAYTSKNSKKDSFILPVAAQWQKAKHLEHPVIAEIYEIAKVDQQLFIAQEYIAGRTLAEWINVLAEHRQKFPLDLAFYVAKKIAEALSYGHNYYDPKTESNVICCHQRMCPQNVMLGFNGRVKVLNYGTAVTDDYQQDPQKLAYMPPEFFSNNPLHARADQYGLGMCLVAMLLGYSPYGKLSARKLAAAVQEGNLPDLEEARPDLSEEMVKMVTKLVHVNARLRFDNMQSVLRLLSQFVQKLNSGMNEDAVGLVAQQHFRNEIMREAAWRGTLLDIDLAPYQEKAPEEKEDSQFNEGTVVLNVADDGSIDTSAIEHKDGEAPADEAHSNLSADSVGEGTRTFTRTFQIVQEVEEKPVRTGERKKIMQQFKPVKKPKSRKFFSLCVCLTLLVGAMVALDYEAAKEYWPEKFL